ncbi:aldehyde dehydrogenase family protein [Nonomuraea sp. NPDC052116]|uniref:aldehyde dehydrogenase family protein n=1 Tax=Nonomuraea sp. NPDC052116 TaxID=3155665 RepID=UPI0034300FD1
MTDFAMTVGGAAAAGTGTFDVVDPATGEVFARAPDCGADRLDQAMAAARAAFPAWRRDERHRRDLLREAAGALEAAAGRLAPILTAEQGKPLKDARREVATAVTWLRYYADLDLPREVSQDGSAEVIRRPLGVVAAITPWNFPIALAMWKIAPALRAGNTMVLKPSPYTPLTTLAMGEMLARILPPGVLNVISGRDPLDALMTAHPVPRKISFTGSTATGKRVAGLVGDALEHGAVAAAGGRPIDRPGYFYQPTVLSGATDGTRIVDEEQFGPALPVIACRDLGRAVERANGTAYGLTASVWSPDLDRAARVAAELDCGQVSINGHGRGVRPDLPFGGHKWSGLGVENGPWGLYGYTELQVLVGNQS